jgi:hypothetical protein
MKSYQLSIGLLSTLTLVLQGCDAQPEAIELPESDLTSSSTTTATTPTSSALPATHASSATPTAQKQKQQIGFVPFGPTADFSSLHAFYFVDPSAEIGIVQREAMDQISAMYKAGGVTFSTYITQYTDVPWAKREYSGDLYLVGKNGDPLRRLTRPFFDEEVQNFYHPDDNAKMVYGYE